MKYIVTLLSTGGRRYRFIVEGSTYPDALSKVKTSSLVAVDEVRMSELPDYVPADIRVVEEGSK